MFSSEPWQLWMLKGLIEWARPWVNWIGGAYVVFWIFGTFLAAEFACGLQQAMTGSSSAQEVLTLWVIFNIVGVPWNFIALGILLFIVLINVKFSIGWRQ